jgi:hypothetical protein
MADTTQFGKKSGVAKKLIETLENNGIKSSVVETVDGTPAIEVEFTSVMKSDYSLNDVFNIMARKGFHKIDTRMNGKYKQFAEK